MLLPLKLEASLIFPVKDVLRVSRGRKRKEGSISSPVKSPNLGARFSVIRAFVCPFSILDDCQMVKIEPSLPPPTSL